MTAAEAPDHSELEGESTISAPRLMAPAAITLTSLCLGLTAIRLAAEGHLELTLLFLILAAVMDGLDGRVARMLDATSKLGEQLDSLVDAVSFGVTPGLVLYFLLLSPTHGGSHVMWGAVLFYCACLILRLARFNSALHEERPEYTREFFVGVPAPAAALLALAPLLAVYEFGHGLWSSPRLVSVWLVLVGLGAVSRIPTYSMKTTRVTSRAVVPLLLGLVIAFSVFTAWPGLFFLLLLLAYLVHIPFAYKWWRWLGQHPEAWDVPKSDRKALRKADKLGMPVDPRETPEARRPPGTGDSTPSRSSSAEPRDARRASTVARARRHKRGQQRGQQRRPRVRLRRG